MVDANSINLGQTGYASYAGAGVFNGRTFQAGTGITLTNPDGIAGNTTISSNGANDLHTSQFIVNSAGTVGTGANFTTIASAIAAAQGTGLNQTIFIMPGLTGNYTENLTLVPNINLTAFTCDGQVPNVTIIGKLTFSSAGSVSISGINLQTNSDFCLAVTGSAASIVTLINCNINANNNTAISYSSSSGSSQVKCLYCTGNLNTTGIGLFSASGAGRLLFHFCRITNTGSSTTASTISAGVLDLNSNEFDFAITSSGTNIGGSTRNNFNTANINTGFTWGGTMTSDFDYYNTGSASGISCGNATGRISNAIVNSTNTNAITGAGTVTFMNIGFEGSSTLINTTTQVPSVASNDSIEVVSASGASYTIAAQDALVLVDGNVTATIVPQASPAKGQKHIIKDNAGTAAAHNITVTPSGKNIDGAASFVINTNFGSIMIVFNGTQWNIV